MDAQTIARYQPPAGDIYQRLVVNYGANNAANIAAAARTGDTNGEVNAAIVNAKYGAPLNESTTSIFLDQITTDPLAAPLAGANQVIGNSVLSFLRNPWVLVAAVAILFFYLGGGDWLRRQLAK